MRRLLWFPVAFGVLAWLLIVPLFGGCEDDLQSERRTPKPVRPVQAPSPDVNLPKAA